MYGFVLKDVIEAVRKNKSYAGVLRALGKNPYSSGSQSSLKGFIHRNSIDTSHFTGQLHGTRRPRKDISNLSPAVSNHALKMRLWRDGLLERKCYDCGITEWNNRPAPLELHHKDGNRLNNSIENLTILCSNCHALTDSYCRRKS